VTYEKKLADVRARLSRLTPEGSQTDPVAVARRLFRLGMDYSPEAVAVVISYLENTSIEADPATEPMRDEKPKLKTTNKGRRKPTKTKAVEVPDGE